MAPDHNDSRGRWSSEVPVLGWLLGPPFNQPVGVIGDDRTFKILKIDFSESELALALIATVVPILLWNILGRLEYYTKFMSRLFFKPIFGVYVSAIFIASLSLTRSALFVQAIRSQPKLDELDSPASQAIGGAIFVCGLVLLIGAYYRLGIRGTYLGDYFGFLMDDMITAFPFNVINNPMYDGSSLIHLGDAIL